MTVMDRDEIRQSAKSRRSSATIEQSAFKKVVWECEYCSRSFATETGFMDHRCAAKAKLDQLKSPTGQAAYSHYSEWMKQKGRSVPPPETFLESRQYSNFIRFAEWSNKLSIPNPKQFIKLMIEADVSPVLWCRHNAYTMFLEWYDGVHSPEEQFIESLEELKQLAVDAGCGLSEIYNVLGAAEIAKLVRKRKLSAWLLVTSKVFLMWAQKLPQHEKDMLNEAIDFKTFANKLGSRPDITPLFKKACESEGI
jgi:hypothetical protein